MSGRRWLLAEAFLWAMLIVASVLVVEPGPVRTTVWNVSTVAYPALLLVCSLALLRPAAPVAPSTRLLLLGAGLVSAALGVHGALIRLEYVDFDGPWLIYYLIPVYLVGAGAAIVERFVAHVHELRRSRGELEVRVAQKTREIEATQARLAAQERERALAGERRRIMADMHDVLGSRLVGLLSLVQSGRTDRELLEQELAASLDELRMSIDSVQPVEGDLGVVLGNVRHRMRSVFGATGVTLDWQVSELPRMEGLTPARVLAIQRLLLEVFSNVLKHSGAQTVRVSTALADGSAQIAIEDNGRGFESRECTGGRGLANLAARARDAGGSLEISSMPGDGTRVTLALPLGPAAAG
jgi:signal transduction histidine kinase